MKDNDKIPLVSVVMSTYNGSKFIKEAIDSILSQTFDDFEFIIWNDGSTDNTEKIIKDYHDPRIRYFYHENTGLGEALHLACEKARGQYIARMDDDDISLPQRLEQEVAFLNSRPECVLVSSAVFFISEDGRTIGRSFPCTSDVVLRASIFANNMIVHPMVMFRTIPYKKAGGYVRVRSSQDRVTWSRLSKYGQFANIHEPLGKYRLLDSSISHTSNPYFWVIYELRTKMIKDDTILDSDVEKYNELYLYSKLHLKKKSLDVENAERKRGWDEMFFDAIHNIVGDNNTERIISSIKNVFFRYKYRRFIQTK